LKFLFLTYVLLIDIYKINTFFRQPTPVKTPTPVNPTPAPPSRTLNDEPWVPHKKELTRADPKPTGLRDPIDLYIDSVRFIPDNATVIKVR
jgi:hypothetical protein